MSLIVRHSLRFAQWIANRERHAFNTKELSTVEAVNELLVTNFYYKYHTRVSVFSFGFPYSNFIIFNLKCFTLSYGIL